MNNKLTKNIEKYFFPILFGIFVLAFLLVLLKPIELLNDSPGYLNMSLIRSPAYPIFVNIIHFLFGDFYLTAVVCIQTLLLLLAVYFLIVSLRKILFLNPVWLLLLSLLLVAPALYEVNISSRILSEGLAYPLYLLVFSHFIRGFSENRLRPLFYALPLLLILLLTRGQFIFLTGIGFLLSTFILWKQGKMGRAWILAGFILVPLLANLIDKTYHYVLHDHFVSTPWTGIHLLTPALFVATEDDVAVFSSEKERNFFSTIYGSLQNKHLNLESIEDTNSETTYFYIQNFTKIANKTVYDEGRHFFETPIESAETFIQLDLLTASMAPVLIKKNFLGWSKLYVQNFFFGMSGAKFTLAYLILLISTLVLLFRIPTPEIKLIFLGSLVTILNMSVVAIGMHTIKRFTFYNDWILFLILFILIHLLTRKSTDGTRS